MLVAPFQEIDPQPTQRIKLTEQLSFLLDETVVSLMMAGGREGRRIGCTLSGIRPPADTITIFG